MLPSDLDPASQRFDLEVLAAAVETADALIVVTDPIGRILRFNPACERLTGYSAEEMIGRRATELLAPGQAAALTADTLELMRTGGRGRSVGTWITASGEERTISFANTVLHDTDGQPRCIVATGVDITQERRAVAALSASERRHRALVEHASDVVVVIDADAGLQYVSPSAERLLGWLPSEVEGRSGLDLVVAADRELVARALAETLEEPGPTVPREFRVRDRWGRPILMEAVANNQLHDPAVNGVILHLRDLSERRSLEATLRTAEERFRQAFTKSPNGIAVVDLDGRFVQVNPALVEILGRDEQELLTLGFQEITHPDDLGADLDYLQRLLAGEIPGYRMEKRYLRPDGGVVWVLLNASVLHGPDGQPLHLLSHVEDITARKSLTEHLAHLAHHDGLTGLPNRTAVHRRLDEALARRHLHDVGVLFVDLDRFKDVNDGYGHDVGDRVLAIVARRLADVVRPSDLVGRVGGDEFVIVCEPATDAVVATVAERVGAALAHPLHVEGAPVLTVGVTVGAIVARPDEDTVAVLRRADEQMYRNKPAPAPIVRLVGDGADV